MPGTWVNFGLFGLEATTARFAVIKKRIRLKKSRHSKGARLHKNMADVAKLYPTARLYIFQPILSHGEKRMKQRNENEQSRQRTLIIARTMNENLPEMRGDVSGKR